MTEIKRTNYATGQFLTAADFTREQTYHRTLHRLHNANLHTWGIAGGLDVTKADDTHVGIAPGLAIDAEGRDIVLADAATLDLAASADKAALYVVITYQEVADSADTVQIGGVDTSVATTERPALSLVDAGGGGDAAANPPPADALVLALLTLDRGRLASIDTTMRRPAGAALPPSVTLSHLTASDRIDCGTLFLAQVPIQTDTFALGQAAIMNADAANALEIVGRMVDTGASGQGVCRAVRLVDTVEVVGGLRVSANASASVPESRAGNLSVDGNIIAGAQAIFPQGVNAGSGTFRSTTVVSDGYYGGDLRVNGRLLATAKTGYVMDRFVNRLGESLEIGDVVVLGPKAPTLAYGPGDSIPVPEVDLTDVAGDTRVCGVVCEVHGESGGKGGEMRVFTDEERAEMALGTVAPGQLGHMVTLGTYAACKVDADIAPIAAGDLLTTSPTRGHAQKVLDRGQAIGAIVGKALAPLASGRGIIPVLVTLH